MSCAAEGPAFQYGYKLVKDANILVIFNFGGYRGERGPDLCPFTGVLRAFTVLSDPGNQIAGQLGILTAPSDGTRAAQLQLGLDLTQVNADGTTALPMPTVVIADADGVIRWIDVHRDYTTRTEPGQVLQAVTETIS